MQVCSALAHELQLRAARSPSSVFPMRPTWLQWCLSSRLRAAHCCAGQLQYSPMCRGRRSLDPVGDSERGRARLFALPRGRPLLRSAVGGSTESAVGIPSIIRRVGERSGVLGASSISPCSSSSGGSSSGDELGTYIQDPNIPRQAIFLPLCAFLCPLHLSHTSAGTSSSASSLYDG